MPTCIILCVTEIKDDPHTEDQLLCHDYYIMLPLCITPFKLQVTCYQYRVAHGTASL